MAKKTTFARGRATGGHDSHTHDAARPGRMDRLIKLTFWGAGGYLHRDAWVEVDVGD